MKYGLIVLVLGLVFAGFTGCPEEPPSQYHDNLAPETEIFISYEDTLNYTTSVQSIAWDGRDPDGFVIGFYYTWEEIPGVSDWKFTTKRSLVFPLDITGADTIYTFRVKAVDDDSLHDPTPAQQRFPIKNSTPVIQWTRASRIPDTTFTVTTLLWKATDLDGDSSIVRFEYALDDTSTWRSVPGYNRTLTLNADSGLTEGNHSFYIRAVDIAGARSDIIRMPEDPADYWYVKEPSGSYLLIDDHSSETVQYEFPDAYYRSMMENVVAPGGDSYSYWNIEKLFPSSVIQFKETLKLFDRVIWYTDLVREDDEHFIAAQVAIPEFLDTGGKAMFIAQFNTGFGAQGDPLAFSPVDSLGKYYNRIITGGTFNPVDDFSDVFPGDSLPDLTSSSFIYGVIALTPKSGSLNVYSYDDPNITENDPVFVVLGKNDNTGLYDFLFSGVPLHQLNGNSNVDEFFNIILNSVFQ